MLIDFNNPKKYNILIVGNFYPSVSSQAFLSKYIQLIHPNSKRLFIVSGDVPPTERYSNLFFTRTWIYDAPSGIIRRTYYYIINQLIISYIIIKLFLSRKLNTIFFLSSPLIPIIIAKILMVKTIRHQGGSFSHQLNGSIGYLKKTLLILIFEKIPNQLFDTVVVEAQNSIKFQNLEKISKKVIIIPQFVDTNQFSFKEIKIPPITHIGFIGALNTNKGADNFCEGIILLREYIKRNNIIIGIWGTGDLLRALKKRINDEELSEYVTFYGEIPHEEIPNVLYKVNLLVVPSLSEGVPNIILEAMACGTIVLSTPVGGIPNIIIDEVTGFIMNDNLPITIKDNIIRVHVNPYHKMILKTARQYVVQNHQYNKILLRYNQILKIIR